MQLSKQSIATITSGSVIKPPDGVFALPERVLQFGTGVLLRALPDYFIDKANGAGIFNGRIVVVKSTNAGDVNAFEEQDNLYTLCIRGIEDGHQVEENRICSPISRVLSAKSQWDAILQCAQNPDLQVIISNTTEVGIQQVEESIFEKPPTSFPAKLLCFLYERFKKLGNQHAAKMVVLPTELITDNGKKLSGIMLHLAQYNNLEDAFTTWLHNTVIFCNTLVDCIVPGKPDETLSKQLEKSLGYTDDLLMISEAYRLWAIEGDETVKSLLSFAAADQRVIITPAITKYKELKLRLLNGTHTLSCGLAHLAGIRTVKEGMENATFSKFITQLMLHEIAPAIPFQIPDEEKNAFGRQVLDRFRNPALQHRWLSITMQYTSKMAQRTVPVLLRYAHLYHRIPACFTAGFAAYVLFMKAVKLEEGNYWGESNGQPYLINDAQAGYYFDLWQQGDAASVVGAALRNEKLWGTDLSCIPRFEAAVNQYMHDIKSDGVMKTLERLMT